MLSEFYTRKVISGSQQCDVWYAVDQRVFTSTACKCGERELGGVWRPQGKKRKRKYLQDSFRMATIPLPRLSLSPTPRLIRYSVCLRRTSTSLNCYWCKIAELSEHHTVLASASSLANHASPLKVEDDNFVEVRARWLSDCPYNSSSARSNIRFHRPSCRSS